MESVCLGLGNWMKNEVLQVIIIQAQVTLWKPHHRVSILRGFLAMNDDLHVDLENSQMLQRIIYKLEKSLSNFMFHNYVWRKGN
jgi:hypothetical protein